MAKILIVDDSLVHLYSLKSIIENEGYEVLTAEDGEHCLDTAQSQHPDLILLDIVMPGMSGFQVNRKLRNNSGTHKIPIIFVSTRDQETDIVWGMRQGAKGYLIKPPDEAELIELINELLG